MTRATTAARAGSRRAPRRGQTLVLVALLLGAMFALAALAIDLGFARLTQLQMQTAADAASLEGLRHRNEPQPADPPPTSLDEYRRERASQIVAWMFDDNLAPAEGDAAGFGAGPLVDLSPGMGDATLDAGRTISIPATFVYKPSRADGQPGLELNLGNETHGDLVAGTFHPEVSPRDAEESNDYARNDFTPDDGNDAPAFLVRLRRTNDIFGLDEQAGVSSRGPPVPYLFERGAMPSRPLPDAVLTPRQAGVTVRATAIAQARRVLSIGRAHDGTGTPGLIPFVVSRATWTAWSVDVGQAVNVTATGNWESDLAPLGRGFSLATVIEPPLDVGRPLPSPSRVADGDYSGYLPIYDGVGDGGAPETIRDRVVAFGSATVSIRGGGERAMITKRAGRVAAVNASAKLARQPGLTAVEWTNTRSAGDFVDQPLMAPALAR